jgi:tRNA-specific 2-thiouridylase
MSGGVDSSVATARMIDAGHEVTGVHLALSRTDSNGKSRGCCTLDDARDARRVADKLGIPFYVWDFSHQFADSVMQNFLNEYSLGNTPNPCLRCNEKIKFKAVLDRALALGFDAVATGHYAQIRQGPNGIEMHRAVDPLKDQSYVLGVLTQEQLSHSFFPLGGEHKPAIRAEAEARGLITAKKPDSHDICFIPDGDTAGFLVKKLGEQTGAIRDVESGDVVGQHRGTFTVTIGQRRGLNLKTPAEDGKPRYVVGIDLSTAEVLVGSPEHLEIHSIVGIDPIWAGPPLGSTPTGVFAQVRAHAEPVQAMAYMIDHHLYVQLLESIRGLATGQAVVIYQGTRVIGSATVAATDRVNPNGYPLSGIDVDDSVTSDL